MAGLRKCVEWMSRGRRSDRIAYVLKEWDLPVPLPGAEWQRDAKTHACGSHRHRVLGYVEPGQYSNLDMVLLKKRPPSRRPPFYRASRRVREDLSRNRALAEDQATLRTLPRT
jgi:hypothetical protein